MVRASCSISVSVELTPHPVQLQATTMWITQTLTRKILSSDNEASVLLNNCLYIGLVLGIVGAVSVPAAVIMRVLEASDASQADAGHRLGAGLRVAHGGLVKFARTFFSMGVSIDIHPSLTSFTYLRLHRSRDARCPAFDSVGAY